MRSCFKSLRGLQKPRLHSTFIKVEMIDCYKCSWVLQIYKCLKSQHTFKKGRNDKLLQMSMGTYKFYKCLNSHWKNKKMRLLQMATWTTKCLKKICICNKERRNIKKKHHKDPWISISHSITLQPPSKSKKCSCFTTPWFNRLGYS
jgi:hypothetical protein